MIAIVGSPPYIDSLNSEKNGIDWTKVKKDYPGRKMHEARIEMSERHHNERRYGTGTGQLGALPPGVAADLTELENEMVDNWTGCYDLGWKGIITDEAFSHPAKFSRGLIFRIVKHLLDENMLRPGDTVVDPFGGVALGGLACMQNGLNWVGVELEEKFCSLGRQNIDLWNARYAAHFPHWGTAQLLQGDSRRLAEVVSALRQAQDVGCVVGSPPYATDQFGGGGNKHDKVIDAMKAGYGSTDGNLGAMKEGQLSAVVTSPPFAGNTGGRGEASRNGIDAALFDRHGGGMKGGTGSDPANLDNLRMGAVVGSPPYEGSIINSKTHSIKDERRAKNHTDMQPTFYGNTPHQLGNDSGETFWTAARLIVEQCALLLPPGAPAVWVTKRYVKNGKVVEFSQQWAALCEACGFEVVHWHRAMLVKDNGTQTDLFGGNGRSNKTERKSFFRRLSEAKAKAAQHWATLSRSDKARVLWEGKADLWRAYRATENLPDIDPENLEEMESLSGRKNPRPNRNRILSNAQSIAWVRDGKPDYEIETAIDWEDVICTVRRPA